MTTRLLIADDHAIMRDGLRRIIEGTPDLVVAAEAVNAAEVIDLVRSARCELVLLDLSMPGASGIDLIKHVRAIAPSAKILVLSMHAEQQYAVRAIRAGASGYLTKDCPADLLIKAIRKVAAGGVYISQAVGEQLALDVTPHTGEGQLHKLLTDREYEVFFALVAGQSVTDIAQRLHLSVKTVSTHKARIFDKMGLDSIAALVRYAVAHNLTELPGAIGRTPSA
jgi:DNA-binding NarL/FixJ family response regulator